MKSIFRYPGGKTKRGIQKWIGGHAPQKIDEYREPFVGGGGLFFSFTPFCKRWINDVNPGLMSVYLALRDNATDFIRRCKSIPSAKNNEELTESGPRGGIPVNKRLSNLFEKIAFDEKEDPAFRYFFVNRTVFAGRVNYEISSRLYFSNPQGWNIVDTQRLEKAAKFISGTEITIGDFSQLFLRPGKNVWIYADPPYVVNSNFSSSSRLYQDNFEIEDHKRLSELALNSPHNVAISYDDHPLIRELYNSPNFVIHERKWAYCGTTSANKEFGKELLICNYQQPSLFNLRDAK